MPIDRSLTFAGARLRQAMLGGSPLSGDTRVMSIALSDIRHAFGGESGAPSLDQLNVALRTFFSGRKDLSPTHVKYVCYGVSVPLDEDGNQRLIDDSVLFNRLIGLLSDYERQERRFRNCYQGLLQSYFSFANHVGEASTAHANWVRLRRYLQDRFPTVLEGAGRLGMIPDWLGTLRDHANLLTDHPCRRYARHLAEGETAELARVFDGLGIDSNSWVWEEVVMAYVHSVCERGNAEFQGALDDVLAYVTGRAAIKLPQLLAVRAAAFAVKRYAQCRNRPEHERLRDTCLSLIGNPWIDPTAWNAHVRHEPARQMVEGWLKRRLIRDFFEVLAKDGAADLRRLNYWLKWEPEISDMWFVLGKDAQRNRSAAFTDVRKRMAGRDRILVDAIDENNAFIMRIGSLLVVEFGVTGNACYFFEASRFPGDLSTAVFSRHGLKNKQVAALWLPHTVYSWEANFDFKMRELLQKEPTSPRPAGESPRQEPAAPFDGLMPAKASRSDSDSVEGPLQEILSLCEANGIEWEDNRPKGGALWVLLEQCRQHPRLVDGLDKLGFAFKPGRGFWLK
ncbi:EH signature domain-containing protein [Caballeronia sp. LZ035]|uniref:EH signature domain-containing protein n=1 Tax=Caballeronia sp. LZ035 TaxID=3038568 RepID=UPI002864732A|nr:EH signature domain-containing protein [Caballeronia sp. LZ035]MDR5760697.1 EH signature domain-containing protein [Caballeronia sp. LZ035]